MPHTEIEAALLAENTERCVPPLPDSEVRSIVASVGRYAAGDRRNGGSPEQTADLLRFRQTDYGNAERLVAMHGHDMRFVHLLGRWMVWDGTRFQRDETGEAVRRAKETLRALRRQALAAGGRTCTA